MPHIIDRRNELAGNLSLYQEIYFINRVNNLVDKLGEGENREDKILRVPGDPDEKDREYRYIEVKWIEMLADLDSESKLNRDPSSIQGMMDYREEKAERFLQGEFAGVGGRTD